MSTLSDWPGIGLIQTARLSVNDERKCVRLIWRKHNAKAVYPRLIVKSQRQHFGKVIPGAGDTHEPR